MGDCVAITHDSQPTTHDPAVTTHDCVSEPSRQLEIQELPILPGRMERLHHVAAEHHPEIRADVEQRSERAIRADVGECGETLLAPTRPALVPEHGLVEGAASRVPQVARLRE